MNLNKVPGYKLVRAVTPDPVRRQLRSLILGPTGEELNYDRVSHLGAQSSNAWIRKSSQIGGWLFEGEHEFLWELATRSKEGNILEIGTWMGKSACILAGACKDSAPGTKLICVDTFQMSGTDQQVSYHRRLLRGQAGTFYIFLQNARTAGFDDAIVPIAAYSNVAIPFLNLPLRMAFVDGAHDFENVKADVELCTRLLLPGGVIALHDANGDAYPELVQYVANNISKDPRFRYVDTRGTIVAFERIS